MATIRHATRSDGETVRRIAFPVLCEYGIPADPDGTDADLMSFGDRPDDSVVHLVAEEDGIIVGALLAAPEGQGQGLMRLSKVMVRAGHRRKGIGTALLEEAARTAQGAGFTEMTVTVRPFCQEAVSLFEARGWLRSPGAPVSAPAPDRGYVLALTRVVETVAA
ncbi:GNAT family N-acetyltransferase [Streptomyces gamaensis]|uniref:GNAT family N-acetyltransferase n=1 Tax=Streptomyces gamaensis TaxID=1763542 RepID=A0ABW0YU18_9ACTN